MKSFLIKWTQAFFYSNIFIAICAVAFYRRGLLIYNIDQPATEISWFVFFSTLFVYLFIRLAAIRRIQEYKKEHRWDFFIDAFTGLVVLMLLSAAASLILFILIPDHVKYFLLLPGLISVLYGLPMYKSSGKWKRLRDFGISKIFLIACVWAFTGAVLPAISNTGWQLNIWQILADFFFIFAITIPFDIKDLDVDALHNVKTIPALVGKSNSYALTFFLLFVSGACYAFANPLVQSAVLPPITIALIITGMLIYATRFSKNNLVYFGWIDGTILLQYVLVYTYLQLH